MASNNEGKEHNGSYDKSNRKMSSFCTWEKVTLTAELIVGQRDLSVNKVFGITKAQISENRIENHLNNSIQMLD